MKATVRYKCGCMQDEGSFEMRARAHDEPLEDFMERMGAALTKDHRERNPLCRSTVTEWVKLPVGKDGSVGGEAEK